VSQLCPGCVVAEWLFGRCVARRGEWQSLADYRRHSVERCRCACKRSTWSSLRSMLSSGTCHPPAGVQEDVLVWGASLHVELNSIDTSHTQYTHTPTHTHAHARALIRSLNGPARDSRSHTNEAHGCTVATCKGCQPKTSKGMGLGWDGRARILLSSLITTQLTRRVCEED
jgi:hypothetical protein